MTQTLPEQIKSYRQEHRLTQSDMGALLGVTGSAVGQWETGATQPRGKHRAAIQRILREPQPYQPEVLAPERIPAHVVELSDPMMTLVEYKKRHNLDADALRGLTNSHDDDPDVVRAVTMSMISNNAYGPDLINLKAFGFSEHSLNQALSHVPSVQDPWTWPLCRRSYIHLVRELIGQLYMSAMSYQPESSIRALVTRGAQLEAVAQRLEHGRVVAAPAIPTNPQEVTIDWQGLVGDYQVVRGVSLRHLVELGLYGKYQDAAAALERDPRNLTASVKISSDAQRGPAGEDYIITDLHTVQMFCARARTEMGARILEVILSHHNELQAMLAGDPEANARHEQAKLPEHHKELDPLDALSSMISQLREQRDRQRALEREMEATRAATQLTAELVTDQAQRLADVETRLNTAPIAGHLSAYQIAERGGYLSSKGRPHASAVVALGDIMGLEEEGEAYRVMTEINEHICPTRRYTPVGAAMLSRELARLARADDAPFFNVSAGTKTYTVYRAQ